MLQTKRLILRKWTETDADSLYEYAKDPAVGPIAGWPPHQSREESINIIRNVLNGAECYAICEKGSDNRRRVEQLMLRRQIIVLIAVFAILGFAVGAVLCFAKIYLPKDRITDLNYPAEFFCTGGENRIDYQTDGNCAAYATAFVLRSLGEQTDGGKIVPEIKRLFGFVPTESIVPVFEKHGFSAKAYHGDVDSLPENKNADGNQYNRKLTTEEFEEIWRTDTVLPDNVYIVADCLNGDVVQ